MDPTQYQQLLEQKRQQYGQQIADTTYYTPPSSTISDQEYQQLKKTKDQKILELYEHDKALANSYSNPESSSYLNDPYARELARANRGKATAGEILDIGRSMTDREVAIAEANALAQQQKENQMKMAQYEMALLQNEFENSLKLQESQKKEDDGSALLTELLNSITGLKNKKEESQKYSSQLVKGVAKNKKELSTISKKYKGSQVSFTKKGDGSYEYSVLPKGAKPTYLTKQEADLVNDPTKLSNELLSMVTAANPKMASAAEKIIKAQFPESDTTKTKLSASQEKAKMGVSSADALYKQIEKESKGKAYGRFKGPGLLALSNLFGMNEGISTYEALRKASIGPIARSISGEVGMLTDKDIARAEGLLPKVTDTAAERKEKLRLLRQAIDEKKYSIESNSAYGGARLVNPATGEIYAYDGPDDPDYINDLQTGFMPQ